MSALRLRVRQAEHIGKRAGAQLVFERRARALEQRAVGGDAGHLHAQDAGEDAAPQPEAFRRTRHRRVDGFAHGQRKSHRVGGHQALQQAQRRNARSARTPHHAGNPATGRGAAAQ